MNDVAEILCSSCGRKFTQRKSLYVHVRKFHPFSEVDLPTGTLTCSECGNKFVNLSNLQSHFEVSHPNITLSFEERTFHSEEDFQLWKENMENASNSYFVKRYRDNQHADGSTVCYYYCHRSGPSQREEHSSKKRRTKCQGSNKILSTCPANIKVHKQIVDEAVELKVQYQSVHVGHQAEVGRMPITDCQKNHLAGLMKQGVPKTEVLKQVQKNFSPTKRLCLTTKKDLHNISQQYKLDSDTVLDKNDMMSVHLRIQKMQSEQDNSVLLYKPIGEELPGHPELKNEFLLGIMNSAQRHLLQQYGENGVMIDATHGTNGYGFLLTTVMVNDSNHEGFPVAILYSKKESKEAFVPFFSAIKDRIGNIKPKVFLSDDAPAFYNAWKEIFGDAEKYLLCAWHVMRNWDRNLCKIKDTDKRADLKSSLKKLMHELDIYTFQKESEVLLNQLLCSEETKEFGEYLAKYYMKRPEQWAYCYRVGAGINVNMKLERWHRQLKYEEGQGKVFRRLDKSLCVIQNAITKKLIGRIVSLQRHKLTKRIADIRTRHDRSQDLSVESIVEMEPRKAWVVPATNSEESPGFLFTYNVTYEKSCDCDIRCYECNVCIHTMSCTCLDYCVRFCICKHIHLVCRNFSVGVSNDVIDSGNLVVDVDLGNQQEECAAIARELKKSSPGVSVDEEKRAVLLQQLDRWKTFVQRSMSPEELNIISENLHIMEVKLAANSAERLVTESINVDICEPANKNIEKQKRLFKK